MFANIVGQFCRAADPGRRECAVFWCDGMVSNHRHPELQSGALPAELPPRGGRNRRQWLSVGPGSAKGRQSPLVSPSDAEPPLRGRPGSPENHRHDVLERAARIELASRAWKARAQPLYHTRSFRTPVTEAKSAWVLRPRLRPSNVGPRCFPEGNSPGLLSRRPCQRRSEDIDLLARSGRDSRT